jgi:cell cycle checkpoint protein
MFVQGNYPLLLLDLTAKPHLCGIIMLVILYMTTMNNIQRGTVLVTNTGFTITVEEARTLLATAYVFADMFDEYAYRPPPIPTSSQSQSPHSTPKSAPELATTTFELPLNTLVECLNLFGTAGAPNPSNTISKARTTRFRNDHGGDDDEGGGDGDRRGPMDKLFGAPGSDKSTGMRLSFAGAGHPLTLLM